MSGGASSSSSSIPVGLDVSNATVIDMNEFCLVLETIPCFDEGRVETPRIENLQRVMLPSQALETFASYLYFIGGKLQSFMDFAVGADAKVAFRFRFLNAGKQLASSQQDASPTNCCVAGCQEMTRPVQLANQRSLRLMQEKWVTLRSVPVAVDRAAQSLLPVASEPVAPPSEGGGPVPEYSATRFTDRAISGGRDSTRGAERCC